MGTEGARGACPVGGPCEAPTPPETRARRVERVLRRLPAVCRLLDDLKARAVQASAFDDYLNTHQGVL